MQGKDYLIFGRESHEKGFLPRGKSPFVFRYGSVIGIRIPRAALAIRSFLTIRRVPVTGLRAIRRLGRVARSAITRAIGGAARLIAVMVAGIIRAVYGPVIGIPWVLTVAGTLGAGLRTRPGPKSSGGMTQPERRAAGSPAASVSRVLLFIRTSSSDSEGIAVRLL